MNVRKVIMFLGKCIATIVLLSVSLFFIWLGLAEGTVNAWEFILLLVFKVLMLIIGGYFCILTISIWDSSLAKKDNG